ncbi:MAG: NAD(P)/FAD-dependent oxidoreductase [Desulfurococcales archaeon]|nr:NAD(P)/FAD-dependent oxidoreductase [Desulfurococcales archaeon]
MTVDTVIAGLGIAGARLAGLLSKAGLKVKAFDPDISYRKPCGEAVPINEYTKYIVSKYTGYRALIRRFKVVVDERTIYEEEFSNPLWYIIDKTRLVLSLRREAEDHGVELSYTPFKRTLNGEKTLTVDARGPFSRGSEGAVTVYRIIYRPQKQWPEDGILVEFDTRKLGFYWIFPSNPWENTVNAGGGFYELPKQYLLLKTVDKYINKKTGIKEIHSKAASLVRIKPKIKLWDDYSKSLNVGEAAGFLVSITGEGIRPGLLSADYLAMAILENLGDFNGIKEAYEEKAAGLVKETELSARLFETVEKANINERGRILSNVPKGFWRDYFKAKLTLPGIVLSALKEPSRGLRLLPYLFRLF